MTSWAAFVLGAALVFGGGQIAPCLGGPGGNDACVATWEAGHPHPSPIFDTTLAWPWITLFIGGLIVILAFSRWRQSKAPDNDIGGHIATPPGFSN